MEAGFYLHIFLHPRHRHTPYDMRRCLFSAGPIVRQCWCLWHGCVKVCGVNVAASATWSEPDVDHCYCSEVSVCVCVAHSCFHICAHFSWSQYTGTNTHSIHNIQSHFYLFSHVLFWVFLVMCERWQRKSNRKSCLRFTNRQGQGQSFLAGPCCCSIFGVF